MSQHRAWCRASLVALLAGLAGAVALALPGDPTATPDPAVSPSPSPAATPTATPAATTAPIEPDLTPMDLLPQRPADGADSPEPATDTDAAGNAPEMFNMQGEHVAEGRCAGEGTSWISNERALQKARLERRNCLTKAEDDCHDRGVNTFVQLLEDPPENRVQKCKRDKYFLWRCKISSAWICVDAYL